MRNKILTAIALVTTVAAGAFAGYKRQTMNFEVVCFVARKISSILPKRKWML